MSASRFRAIDFVAAALGCVVLGGPLRYPTSPPRDERGG
jgi:hypothetical protein